MSKQQLKTAFSASLPVLFGYLTLGIGYGLYMQNLGFAWWYSTLMAATIYGGSVEFIIANMLTEHFQPLTVLLITFVVSFRQIFYSIAFLDKYQAKGIKKFIQIFALSDETFAVNYFLNPAPADAQNVYTLVSLLDWCYWVVGATCGSVFGTALHLQIKGLDFIMTALFIVLAIDQFKKSKRKLSSVSGLVITIICLLLFGTTYFLIAALLLLALEYIFIYKKEAQA